MASVKITALFFTFGVLLYSSVFAFTESHQETSLSEEEPKYPQNNFQLALKSNCRDILTFGRCTEEYCQKYPTRRWEKRMRKNCRRTCGFCRAQSPPGCFNSEYGCCWDYVTSAIGPGGRGCPPCEDNTRYPNVCQRFRSYCRRKGISGRWMRTNCPDSCGHCGTCMDTWVLNSGTNSGTTTSGSGNMAVLTRLKTTNRT